MATFTLPYGRATLTCEVPAAFHLRRVALAGQAAAAEPVAAVEAALDNLLGDARWDAWAPRSVAIAVNDKTRPVPHAVLLPPLLRRLAGLGLPPAQITLIIATGAHPPMAPEDYMAILPADILDRYPVRCHDADAEDNLRYLGQTSRGTPVWINREYLAADLRVVVGNIEPHQFQGFSGGVKSAAIGLAGRATINHNHAMMTHPQARLGVVDDNPARQDVEEIGQLIGVPLALNAILNGRRELVRALAGSPAAVLAAGMPLARALCQVAVRAPFDLVIASPGGHPKDINMYQAQKGLAHAALVTKEGGTVILAAACPEGAGSRRYEQWVSARYAVADVLADFAAQGFRVGPHKAFQIARDLQRVRLLLVSDMDPALVRRLLLTPAASLQAAVDQAVAVLPPAARIGVMPEANVTIPLLSAAADG